MIRSDPIRHHLSALTHYCGGIRDFILPERLTRERRSHFISLVRVARLHQCITIADSSISPESGSSTLISVVPFFLPVKVEVPEDGVGITRHKTYNFRSPNHDSNSDSHDLNALSHLLNNFLFVNAVFHRRGYRSY